MLDLQGEIVEITSTLREEQVAHQETKRQFHRLQILYDGVKQRELELLRSKSIPSIPYSGREPLQPVSNFSNQSYSRVDLVSSTHSKSNPPLNSQRQFSFRSS